MRLGLIGLGRIGAFHADTLSHLDEVDSLVVTDAVPAVTAAVAARFDAKPAESPEELISSGVDGIVIAAATDAHTALINIRHCAFLLNLFSFSVVLGGYAAIEITAKRGFFLCYKLF